MLNVDFEEATLNLKSVIAAAKVVYVSKEDKKDEGHWPDTEITKITETAMISFTSTLHKCVTLDIYPNETDRRMPFVTLVINNSIFQDITSDILMLQFNYPKQLLRPIVTHKYSWPKRSNYSSNFFQRQFILNSMEVLHRRNKALEPCLLYSNYDKSFQADMMQKIGCRPPYWMSAKNLPQCNNKEKLKTFASDITVEGLFIEKHTKYIPKPCLELQKLNYHYAENDLTLQQIKGWLPTREISDNDSIMIIIIDFIDQTFKEIRQVNAFGIESLIGNVGGYIGLFLGVSIIQLPTFCLGVKRWLLSRERGTKVIHVPHVDLQKEDMLSTVELGN